jgi:glutamine synthetase
MRSAATDTRGCDLVALVCCDLGSIVRGRSILSSDLALEAQASVGWVPSAQALTPLGPSVDPNPFGSTGDLRLAPDRRTQVAVAADEGCSALEFVLCDIVETDGEPWDCCPRTFLREALHELERELGARLLASFEHEFQLLLDTPPGPPMSLEAQRTVDPFPARVMAALLEAGAAPERFLAECSAHQFEIPVAAAEGVASADRSVTLREVVREIARRQGTRATFVPLLDPAEQGNGVHIHLTLRDAGGRFLFYDPDRPACLSELGGRFVAGILTHARALAALTAPSPVSCARLQPNRWSAGAVCVGQRNREALLRIPPLLTLAGSADPATQLHLEYRGADSAANPYLALGALVRAGLWGVREQLSPLPILDRDPAQLGPEDAARYGVGGLPATLEESLRALVDDPVVRGWMTPRLHDVYASIKRAEIDAVAGQELGEICRRYAAVY